MLILSGPRIVTQVHGWNTYGLLLSCGKVLTGTRYAHIFVSKEETLTGNIQQQTQYEK